MTMKPIIVGLSCLLLLNASALGQKPVKGPHASTTTQKNADGTVTKSTTTYADGVNVKTTTGKQGTVDVVITEPDLTYGTAGTKVTVKSYQDKPQPEGPPIKDWKTLVEYKEKSISGEISKLISSTERRPDLTGDLSPGPLPDVGETSKQKEEPPKPKTPSTPSTSRDVRPRRSAPPPKVTTGSRTATGPNRSR